MWGRQRLSRPVLRPASGPNARPQDSILLHKGNNENSLELIPIKEIITSQDSRVRPAFQDPDDKSEGIYPPLKGPETSSSSSL